MAHSVNRFRVLVFGLVLCISHSVLLGQVPTTLIVRAKAMDGKFIGSSIGGALILVKDAYSGEVLAKGLTEGSTGNTRLIMFTPHARGQSIVDEATAKFVAQLNIDKPLFVQVDVMSPYAQRQATVLASTQLWILPGKHIDGDGLIIEIPGFIINVLHPTTHRYISLNDIKDKQTEIRANVVMMCGCVIEPGSSVWDGNKMEVEATIYLKGKPVGIVMLKNIEMNIFLGYYNFREIGNYEVIVSAFDRVSKNTGVDKVQFVVE